MLCKCTARRAFQACNGFLKNFATTKSPATKLIQKRLSQHNHQSVLQQTNFYSTTNGLVFRQLFHGETFTYTYILGCSRSRKAVIIDPVNDMVSRDLKLSEELQLSLIYGLNTHVHADHVTGTGALKERLSYLKSVISTASGAEADIHVKHGDKITFGEKEIECRYTPGHTNGCMTYVLHEDALVFPGDALLIRSCGRTDFQEGSSETLYESVHEQIFSLPKHYFIYPAHDYRGFSMSTVGEEKLLNPRLALTKEKFVVFMKNLNLAYPNLIDESLPANIKCGKISREANLGSDSILK